MFVCVKTKIKSGRTLDCGIWQVYGCGITGLRKAQKISTLTTNVNIEAVKKMILDKH